MWLGEIVHCGTTMIDACPPPTLVTPVAEPVEAQPSDLFEDSVAVPVEAHQFMEFSDSDSDGASDTLPDNSPELERDNGIIVHRGRCYSPVLADFDPSDPDQELPLHWAGWKIMSEDTKDKLIYETRNCKSLDEYKDFMFERVNKYLFPDFFKMDMFAYSPENFRRDIARVLYEIHTEMRNVYGVPFSYGQPRITYNRNYVVIGVDGVSTRSEYRKMHGDISRYNPRTGVTVVETKAYLESRLTPAVLSKKQQLRRERRINAMRSLNLSKKDRKIRITRDRDEKFKPQELHDHDFDIVVQDDVVSRKHSHIDRSYYVNRNRRQYRNYYVNPEMDEKEYIGREFSPPIYPKISDDVKQFVEQISYDPNMGMKSSYIPPELPEMSTHFLQVIIDKVKSITSTFQSSMMYEPERNTRYFVGTALFLYNMFHSRSYGSVLSAVTNYLMISSNWDIKLICQASVAGLLYMKLCNYALDPETRIKFLDPPRNCHNRRRGNIQVNPESSDIIEVEPEALTILDEIRKFSAYIPSFQTLRRSTDFVTTSARSVISSDAANTIRSFILSAASLHFFKKDHAHKIYGYLGKIDKSLGTLDLIEMMFSALSKLFEYGELLMKGIHISDIFTSKDPISTCTKEINELLTYSERLYSGLPVPGKMWRNTFITKGYNLLQVADELLRKMNLDVPRLFELKKKRDLLYNTVVDRENSMRTENRPMPFGIVLHGDPEIGKSLLLTYFAKLLVKAKDPDIKYHDGLIYHRAMNSEFWEELDPLSHIIYHFSEVGNLAAKIAQAKGDPVATELISVMDKLPYPVNQAKLENKGKVFVRPEMVIVDTNNWKMNLDMIVNNPAAFYRRFVYIKPTVLPQFRRDGGTGLDTNKSLAADTPLLDRYTFEVMTMIPKSNTSYTPCIQHIPNIYELTEKLLYLMKAHIAAQECVDKAMLTGMEPDSYLFRHIPQGGEAVREIVDEKEFSILEDDFKDRLEVANGILTQDEHISRLRMRIDNTVVPQYNVKVFRDKCAVKYNSYKFLRYNHSRLDCLKLIAKDTFEDWLPDKCWFTVKHYAKNFLRNIEYTFFYIFLFFILNFLRSNFGLEFHYKYPILLCAQFLVIYAFCREDYFWCLCCQAYAIFVYIQEASSYGSINTTYRRYLRRKFSSGVLNLGTKTKDLAYSFVNDYKVQIVGAIIGAIATYKLIGRFVDEDKSVTEEKSDAIENEKVHTLEELINAGGRRKRTLKMDDMNWNSQTHVDVPTNGNFRSDFHEFDYFASANLRHVGFDKGNSMVTTFGLGIVKNFMFVNKHSFVCSHDQCIYISPDEFFDHDIAREKYRKIPFSKKDYIDFGNDLILMRLNGHSFGKNLLNHIPKSLDKDSYEAFIIPDKVKAIVNKTSKVELRSTSSSVTGCFDYTWTQHKPGSCGIPLYIKTAKTVALGGIHFGTGDNGISHATILYYGDVYNAIERLKDTELIQVNTEHFEHPLVPIKRKSPFNYVFYPGIELYGTLDEKVRIKRTSKLTHVPFYKEMTEVFEREIPGIYTEYGRPVMTPYYTPRVVSPQHNALRKLDKQKGCLDRDIILRCVDYFTNHIVKNLEKKGVVSLQPIAMQDAINGVEGDAFTRRMNLSTSAGFGLPGKKRDYCYRDENGIDVPTMELINKALDIIRLYEEEKTSNSIYTVQLKDEPRTLEKIRDGKTRLFYIQPMDLLIVHRMFLSPFYTLMVEYSDVFGTAVGINMYKHSHALRQNLFEFSPNIFEGDYGNYDQCMPYMISLGSASVVRNVLVHFGYNDKAMKIVEGILADNMKLRVALDNDILGLYGMQPSGKYATAEDNSLKNVMLLLYFWFSHPVLKNYDFFENVRPVSYGDDILASVKPKVSQYFNIQTYKLFCEEIYKLDFTTPDKKDTQDPFTTIDRCTFLKRSFFYNTKLKRYVAVLDKSSLLRTLTWFIPSASVGDFEQISSAVRSVLYELSVFLSEKKYNIFRDCLISLFGKYFPYDTIELITYDQALSTIFEERVEVDPEFLESKYSDVKWLSIPKVYRPQETVLRDTILQPDNKQNLPRQLQVGVNRPACEYQRFETKDNLEYMLPGNFEPVETQLIASLDAISKRKDVIIERISTLCPGLSERDPEKIRYLAYNHKTTYNPHHLRRLAQGLSEINDCDVSMRKLEGRFSSLVNPESLEIGLQKSGEVVGADKDENFTQIPGEEVSRVSAGDSDNTDLPTRMTDPISEFLSRPVLITKGQWALNVKSSFQMPVWALFTRNPAVRGKLRNVAYLRGDLHVKIIISGMNFHYGKVLVSYQPWPENNDTLKELTNAYALNSATFGFPLTNYLSQAEGSYVLDIKDNTPLDIVCPFIAPKPMMNLYNPSAAALGSATDYEDFIEMGDLWMITINNLSADSPSPTAPYYMVYAYMTNVEYTTNTATQIVVAAESKEKEYKQGPIERFSSKMAKLSKVLTRIPIIAPLAQAGNMISSSVRDVAAVLGWSRPIMDTPIAPFVPRPYTNTGATIGNSTARKVTLDPEQGIEVSSHAVASHTDDMVINTISSRWGFYNSFNWTPTQVPYTNILARYKVHPNYVATYTVLPNTYSVPMPCAFAVQPFQYWRGDIEFRFEFVCSQFHRGSVAIFWEPNITQQGLMDASMNLNKRSTWTLDLQETQTIEIKVKWNAYREWLKNMSALEATYMNVGTNFDQGYCNGYLGVTPLTELQSPGGTTIYCNVYIRCSNLRVNCLNDANMPYRRIIYSLAQNLESGREVSPPDSEEVDPENCETVYKVSQVTINPNNSTDNHISEKYFGEEPISFRALLKRYVTTKWNTLEYDASTSDGFEVSLPIFPPNRLDYGLPTSVYQLNLFDYLRLAYLGYRGSIRYILNSSGPVYRYDEGPITITLDDPTDTNSVGTITGLGLNPWPNVRTNGTTIEMPYVNSGIEFELPYYSNNLYAYACNNDGGDMFVSYVAEPSWYRNFTIRTTSLTTSSDFGKLYLQVASGEDFSFMRFLGSPYYSTIP